MTQRSTDERANPALSRFRVRDTARTMVPMAFVKNLASYLWQQGLDPMVAMPDLAAAWDGHTQSARYPAEPYCQMLMRAAELLDDPLLGLHLGQALAPTDLGALGYILMSCSNLGETLLRIRRYHRLVNDVTPLRHRFVDNALELCWGIDGGKMGALYDESGIAAFVEFGRRLTGRHLSPLAISFVNPPPDNPAPYICYFGCPVIWGQDETCLRIPFETLQVPLLRADGTLLMLMEPQVDQVLATLSEPASDLEDAVLNAVAKLARGGVPELPQVAAELRMSPRVLYRRLGASGLSFRVLRDRALKDLAESLLSKPEMGLAEVGERLGYTELSAFIRAFKRWTGWTPMAWRRSQLPELGGSA